MIATDQYQSDSDLIVVPPEQLEQLLQFQRDALEMIAIGEPTNTILERICLLAEAMVPNSVASIMLLDSERSSLWVRTAPSIPQEGIDALNGLQPGPQSGSCGTAVYCEDPVFVSNILSDPRWARFINIAERFNLQACWSVPVRCANETVIGSFALTSFESRPPDAFHRRLLDTGSYLAGIVLEREQHAENLMTAAVAFDHMSEAVMVTDSDKRIIQVNSAFERITGYSSSEVIGQTPRVLRSGRQDDGFYKDFFETLDQTGEWRGEIWNRRKNGDIYPELLSVRAVKDVDGNVHRFVSVFADISDIKDSERKLWKMAHRDTLSDLPNRLLLNTRMEHAIQRAQRTGDKIAVLFIDLDRFKNVNDSLGHLAGDELLKQVATRLRACVHEDDTVARLGGDEFIVLLEGVPDANATLSVAERLINVLGEPFDIAGRALYVTASIGISLYPEDADEPNTLLQHADAAMYQAKSLGRNQLAFYSPELTRSVQYRLDLENDLRNALAKEEFVLHYQPLFSAADGGLVGLEALIRWQHPKKGLIPPNHFIPIAEETGIIRQLGRWVTETACKQAQEWRQAGHRQFKLAVNVSAYQLDDSCAHCLAGIFESTGFPPEHFEIEVTESVFIEKGGVAIQDLTNIREQLGVGIVMDDFGTGHSSLSQLKLLPIGKLKIDRSFVSDLPDDSDDAAIAQAIILMAHTLGLSVVAEGVETEEQKEFLYDCGCDYMQGFLFAKPMPANKVSKLLETWDSENRQICPKS